MRCVLRTLTLQGVMNFPFLLALLFVAAVGLPALVGIQL